MATTPGHAAAAVHGNLSYVSRLPFKCFETVRSLVCDKPSRGCVVPGCMQSVLQGMEI